MRVEFLEKFNRDLGKLHLRKSVLTIVLNIEAANNLSQIPNLKKLQGFKSAYRIRIGDYRLIEKDIVQFARISHRKEIYKLFP